MDAYTELANRLKNINLPRRVFYQGIVQSVEGLTCTVLIEGLEIPDIRLRASTSEEGEQLLITPQVGSVVLVASLSGDFLDLAIISVDKADKILLHGGKQGGLVLVNELTQKLNTLESELNELKQIFASWQAVPNDGGRTLQTLLQAQWAGKQLTPTQAQDLENPNIKQ